MRCAAKTKVGERCKLDATHGSYCYQHSPDTTSERRRNARRGGKVGGNGRPGTSEIVEAKRYTRELVAKLARNEIPRETATACFMGINTLARLLELERRVRETEDLAAEIGELHELIEGPGGVA